MKMITSHSMVDEIYLNTSQGSGIFHTTWLDIPMYSSSIKEKQESE